MTGAGDMEVLRSVRPLRSGMVVVSNPGFTAAVEIMDGKVARAAPILKYMMGWRVERVLGYAETHGWQALLWEDGNPLVQKWQY